MLGNVLGAVGSFMGGGGGDLISSAVNLYEGRKNREFQRDMSNTAYRRAVYDLREAGLNPILAAFGGGASTPSGAMGQASSLSSAASAATQAKVNKKEAELLEEKKETENKLQNKLWYEANLAKAMDLKTKNETAILNPKARIADLDVAFWNNPDNHWLREAQIYAGDNVGAATTAVGLAGLAKMFHGGRQAQKWYSAFRNTPKPTAVRPSGRSRRLPSTPPPPTGR